MMLSRSAVKNSSAPLTGTASTVRRLSLHTSHRSRARLTPATSTAYVLKLVSLHTPQIQEFTTAPVQLTPPPARAGPLGTVEEMDETEMQFTQFSFHNQAGDSSLHRNSQIEFE